MYTVDIDTGGTMTDALVSDGASRYAFKVDTTPHDYTVSFLGCLKEAAEKLAYENVVAFLKDVSLIRWSSTITTNVLGERRGAKVGLLVSEGHESDLYGDGQSVVVGELIQPEDIIGLTEQASHAEILAAVKQLLQGGVRRICVCLKHAFPNNSAEEAIKSVIEDQYPDHIIGAVPVLLGSEMAQLRHDQTRVHYSLMNAYTHTQLANSLFKAEDLLRDECEWSGPLLIGHTNGGVSKISKTKAVDTMESGPVFGTFGGAYMAKQYGIKNIACFDVGGTTTKMSIVKDGQPMFQRGGELMEVPVQTSFAMLRSAVVGGGSIAKVANGNVVLGPESMGAAPGPACYGLGGKNATLTDALLVLGYLDPKRFLNGRRILDVEKSMAAIEKNVAKPLGIAAEMAAFLIRDEAVAIMAELVQSTLEEAHIKPEETAMFAFGGNGPMFAALVSDEVGIPSVHAFDLGPVFSAFGSSISDVVHVYERGVDTKYSEAHKAEIGEQLANLRRLAARELISEGFDPEQANYVYEVELGHGDELIKKAKFEAAADTSDALVFELSKACRDAGVSETLSLQMIRLSSRYPVGAHPLEKRTRKDAAVEQTKREMRFGGSKAEQLSVYQWESLQVGDSVEGPSMINGQTLTCPIPPGWKLKVDDFGNAHLQRH